MPDFTEFDIKKKTKDKETVYYLDDMPHRDEKSVIQLKKYHHYLELQFRQLYKTASGRRGDKITYAYRWYFSPIQAVQIATLFIDMAEKQLLAEQENPRIKVVADSEKADYPTSWLVEDFKTAEKRVRNRTSRLYMTRLFQRMVGLSDDEELINTMANMLAKWAENEGGEFEKDQAKKMLKQLGGNNEKTK